MPRFCAVINCGSRGDRDKKSFYRIPAALSRGGNVKINLSRERRQKWIAALNRADLNDLKLKYSWICQDHFISGKPAELQETDNPDWVPNKDLGYYKDNAQHSSMDRYEHVKKKKLALQDDSDSDEVMCTSISVGTQTDLTMHDLESLINASVEVICRPRSKVKKL